MIWLLILVPILGGLALLLAAPRRAAGAAGALVLAVVAMVGLAAAWQQPAASLAWGGPLRLELGIAGVARILVVLVPVVAAPIVLFAGSVYRDDRSLRRLVGLLVAFVGAMELLLMAADLLTLLIAWELVAAFSWALIAHHWQESRPPQAAAEAFVTVRFGAIGLFVAAGAAWAGTGSLSFRAIAGGDGTTLALVAAGFLLAAAAKSAQVPFSYWLFSAMEGPSPVSALLHSATMVAAGAYVLIRLQPVLGPVAWFGPAVITIGLVSALAGGVVALLQTDFKRALAASTTAQYGLMLIAVGAGSVAAASAQLVTHAFFKSLLFLAAGFALSVSGTGALGRLRLGRSERMAAVLCGIGALALAAVPPLGGAFSKEFVLASATAWSPWLGAGVLLAGFLSALYAGRLFALSYGPSLAGGRSAPAQAPQPSYAPVEALPSLGACAATVDSPGPDRARTPLWAMGFLAAGSLVLGVLALPVVERALERLTGGDLAAGRTWQLGASLASIAVAFALLWLLSRRGALLTLGVPAAVQTQLADWLGLPTAVDRGVAEPVLVVARALRRFDDHVIDAGVWGTARTAGRLAARALTFDDRIVDGLVWGVARASWLTAVASRVWDDVVVDGAVEWIARANWWAGKTVRRLQNGMVHDYYIIIAVGVVIAVVVTAVAS
jgi:NADH:ubiquinone oxidoreductase subunit 5 (subunit L)/multisubunit Na+/H+ antiporter MnhA subunit